MEERKFLKGRIKRNIYSRHAMLREYLLKKAAPGTPTGPSAATIFPKTLSGHVRQTSKENLTEVYLLQGMKNFAGEEEEKKKT